jgi:PST family polysaccharide transporter
MAALARSSPAIRDPLNTDHLLNNLGRRTASNATVTTAAQGVRFATNIVSTLVLARLLTPQDFGLVAMVTAFTGFLEVLKDAGLSTATVQRQEINQAQVSNLFWANLVIGFVITCLVSALSPALAWFYHEPRLVPVAITLSLTFLLTASAVQHQAILRRQMRFAAVATIQVVSSLLGLSVAIAMAVAGEGYWSLVGSLLTSAVSSCVVTWLLSDWRPGLPVRHVGTFALLGFGAHLTGAALVQTVMGMVDTLLIGRFYGPNAVGLYTRGAALLLNPLQQFLSPFHAVVVPTLSRVQNDPERYRRVFLQILQVIALLALPLAGFVLAAAEPLVLVFLGEKWAAAIPIFSAFSIVAIYAPLANASTWLFTSQGRGQEVLACCLATSFVSLVSIVAGLPFGPSGIALSYSLSGLFIRLPILFHFAGKSGPVRTRDLWRCFLVNVPLGLLIFVVAFAVRKLLSPRSAFVQLSVLVPLCAAVSVLFVLVSPSRRRIATDVIGRFRATVTGRFSRTATVRSGTPTGQV